MNFTIVYFVLPWYLLMTYSVSNSLTPWYGVWYSTICYYICTSRNNFVMNEYVHTFFNKTYPQRLVYESEVNVSYS